MKDLIYDLAKSYNYLPIWKDNKLTCFINEKEVVLYEVQNQTSLITLCWFSREHGFDKYQTEKIICNTDEEMSFVGINYGKIQIKHSSFIMDMFSKVVEEDINEIEISENIDKYSFENNRLKVNKELMLEIHNRAFDMYSKTRSYGNAVRTYLINKALGELDLKNVRKTTLVEKGELSVFVDRMNLATKQTRKDFDERLTDDDLDSVQALIKKMLELGVFEKEFIEMLDAYFIRKKLEDILETGQEILSLKSQQMDTVPVSNIKSKNLYLMEANILEELWQRFFEENLLYLLFSYQELHPKIELNVIVDEQSYSKKPDFIGINHYGGVDIIEIKHHLTPALTYDSSHKNFVISAEFSKAIVQVTNYIDALIENQFTHENISGEIKRNILSGNLNRPRAIIIISSTDNLVKKGSSHSDKVELIKRDFTKIRNSFNNITILTFDEILDIANRYKNNIVLTDEE